MNKTQFVKTLDIGGSTCTVYDINGFEERGLGGRQASFLYQDSR